MLVNILQHQCDRLLHDLCINEPILLKQKVNSSPQIGVCTWCRLIDEQFVQRLQFQVQTIVRESDSRSLWVGLKSGNCLD